MGRFLLLIIFVATVFGMLLDDLNINQDNED